MISREVLHHFKCNRCGKWWTVGDAPTTKKRWYCTWCGVENVLTENIVTLAEAILMQEHKKQCNNSGCKCPDCYRNAGNEVWE